MLASIDPEFLFADGLDDCIIGFTVENNVPVVLYSTSKVIKKLRKDMTEDEAIEFFEFNINGAYVGERTPVFWNDYDA
jgi:hypothetical protein